ncbi:MAG TPA: hypothetical protein VH475_23245 [Tepidisphaeraceae bacterium]|jgi:hypothetical protein
MNAQKIIVKLFLQDPAQAHGVKLLPVFQTWIQTHAMDDHLMIDVADYDHVHEGPGTVLVTHEANLSLDHQDGRVGLQYQRKQPLPGTFAQRLAAVFRYALEAAARLEDYPGLRFRTDEISVQIGDRLLAPNTPETFKAVKPELEAFLLKLLGPSVSFDLAQEDDPDKLFGVTIKSTTSAAISDLLAKLQALAAI